ncbi:ferric-rhodotorulic acid/ferric-coprogen receptor FhuE [Kushneria marisflavi]|uniref:Ferric-rhodotorulic acid/ferric-coprogen receptor FhuE n=1 Tax=Kushneria marisflavi TaxID=157779 RepID=A0A240UTA7_9GAMM|nr:ferric-rhodotorulic acid/ferric-coprogen receptor FhuE [Kushneria marisflavi]ART64714.1 ferric-rhodotorulic acid/ferric-coprogen receptor FhuE [Kushneria marisflavi]RKD84440.1 outer membrane receptor for ferric coprogen and ferric-rhodotorulic acid [Kushneria marisflavi]
MKKPSCGRHALTIVTTGACLITPVMAQADDAAIDTLTVTATNLYENVGYTRRAITAGTRMNLSPKEIPQSVSVMTEQRIRDQNLRDFEDILANTTGISVSGIDSTRRSFYSRGFLINNYQFDDIPTTVQPQWYMGDAALDSAIYDRVEVVRGANGLLTGAGNPGASVNFVRKHADAYRPTGTISGELGSHGHGRTVIDAQTPLTESGDIRGRFIGGYEDGNGILDRFSERKKFGYAVIDADVTDNTTVSLGYEYQNTHQNDVTWGGLPLLYSDGSRTDFDRDFSVAPRWSFYDHDSEKVFAELNHQFDNGWELRGVATHATLESNNKLLYMFGFPDRQSGLGLNGGAGRYESTRRMDAVDTYVDGPFELLGREHELVAGISYNRQHTRHTGAYLPVDTSSVDIHRFDGRIEEPEWGEMGTQVDDVTRQRAFYTATRLSLTDPLTLILGARYTDWQNDGLQSSRHHEEVIPYGGLVYDINDTWSAFASYTEIFMPQDYRDSSGAYLDPITGKNYETGLKAGWYDDRLTASFSIFRLEQDNVAQADGNTTVPGTGDQAYTAARGVVSEGFDFELNGAVTERLDTTLGITRYTAKNDEGGVNTNQPRTQIKLFSSYRVPQWEKLTVGGGVNWQNRTFSDIANPDGGTTRVQEGSFAIVDLFGRYQFTPDLSLQANIKNLFDKEYYGYLGTYGVYGAPRSATATLTYSF